MRSTLLPVWRLYDEEFERIYVWGSDWICFLGWPAQGGSPRKFYVGTASLWSSRLQRYYVVINCDQRGLSDIEAFPMRGRLQIDCNLCMLEQCPAPAPAAANVEPHNAAAHFQESRSTMMLPMFRPTMMPPMSSPTMMPPMYKPIMMLPMSRPTMMPPMSSPTMMPPMYRPTMMLPMSRPQLPQMSSPTMLPPMSRPTMLARFRVLFGRREREREREFLVVQSPRFPLYAVVLSFLICQTTF